MAKQPVITNAFAINTGRVPNEQGKAVRVDLFFDAATPNVNISLSDVMMNGGFTTIQCMLIDNSLNPATVIITFPGIQQRIIVNGFSQSLEPVYVSDTTCSAPVVCTSITGNIPGFPVSLWFSNVPQPFFTKSDLLNRVFAYQYPFPLQYTQAVHTYDVDTSAIMLANNVADWPCLFVDNTRMMQHLYVYDKATGYLLQVIEPYSSAQFPTLGQGGAVYTFTAYDPILAGAQAGFVYFHNVSVIFKSKSFPSFQQRSLIADTGLYVNVLTPNIPAGGNYLIPYRAETRRVLGMSAANQFYAALTGMIRSSTLVFGVHCLYLEQGTLPNLCQWVTVYNGAVAQIVTIIETL